MKCPVCNETMDSVDRIKQHLQSGSVMEKDKIIEYCVNIICKMFEKKEMLDKIPNHQVFTLRMLESILERRI